LSNQGFFLHFTFFILSKVVLQVIVGVIVFILLGWVFMDIYIYFGIAIVFSSILRPLTRIMTRFQLFRLRMPRLMAVLLSFAIFSLIIFFFTLLFVPLISEQIGVISSLDYLTVSERIGMPVYKLESFLIEHDLTSREKGFIVDQLREQSQVLLDQINIGNVINQIISFTGSFFIGVMAVLFISFFLLYEMGPIRKKFISLIPNKYFEVTIAALNKIERLLSNYLLGLFLQMISIFTLASIGLSVVGVKYAITIAMFAALANLIPYLGPIFGATFAIIVGITVTPDLLTMQDQLVFMSKVLSVFAIVQITDNILLQPLIFSKSIKAHPLEIFVIIFAGATLAGIVGMIIAIPVYTVIRVYIIELYKGYNQYKVFHLQKVKLR